MDGRKTNVGDRRSPGYSADAILRDGTPVCIRAIRPDDKERLAGHFARLSSDSRYHRFFGFRSAFTPPELSCLTEPDFLRHVALVATIEDGTGSESIVGDGRYVALPDRCYAAELGLSVVDAYQRRSIGTLLLEHLIRLARHARVRRLEADVMGVEPGCPTLPHPTRFQVLRNVRRRVPRGTIRGRTAECERASLHLGQGQAARVPAISGKRR
jgi:GNAT superfamily N-acetyltransferase